MQVNKLNLIIRGIPGPTLNSKFGLFLKVGAALGCFCFSLGSGFSWENSQSSPLLHLPARKYLHFLFGRSSGNRILPTAKGFLEEIASFSGSIISFSESESESYCATKEFFFSSSFCFFAFCCSFLLFAVRFLVGNSPLASFSASS